MRPVAITCCITTYFIYNLSIFTSLDDLMVESTVYLNCKLFFKTKNVFDLRIFLPDFVSCLGAVVWLSTAL